MFSKKPEHGIPQAMPRPMANGGSTFSVIGPDVTPDRGAFLNPEEFRPSDLPTVMRKAYDLALGAFAAVERAGARV